MWTWCRFEFFYIHPKCSFLDHVTILAIAQPPIAVIVENFLSADSLNSTLLHRGRIKNLKNGVYGFRANMILHPHMGYIVHVLLKIRGCIAAPLKMRGCIAHLHPY